MTDKNEAVRAIIEDAIERLMAVGFDKNGAGALLAIQGSIRIDETGEGVKALRSVATFIAETLDLLDDEEAAG